MQIARNTPAKTPPLIPLTRGTGEYAAKPRQRVRIISNPLTPLTPLTPLSGGNLGNGLYYNCAHRHSPIQNHRPAPLGVGAWGVLASSVRFQGHNRSSQRSDRALMRTRRRWS